MSISLKSLLVVAAVGLFSSGAHAEKVRVEMQISKLSASFVSKGAGQYKITDAQAECTATVSADGDESVSDCSQSAAVTDGVELQVKKNGKKLEITMVSKDANGKVTREKIRGQLTAAGVQDGRTGEKYKMDVSDLKKKFSLSISEQNASLRVSVKIQGEGEILVLDNETEIQMVFPKITVVLEGSVN